MGFLSYTEYWTIYRGYVIKDAMYMYKY